MKKENGMISSPNDYYKVYKESISELADRWVRVDFSLKVYNYMSDLYFAVYAWFVLNPWYTYSARLTSFIVKPFWVVLVVSFTILIMGNHLLKQMEDTYIAYYLAKQGMESCFEQPTEGNKDE